ncbi:hypothetical protein TCSYLVIO_007847 [Trypanosoma cruzi]|nr:hypothetical protein TCSYLVIO_007847 [Trypanosoma cruzi]
MNRHHRLDSLSNTAGTSCDSPFQRFINTTCLFHKQRMLCGVPQIHFVPIARLNDGPQHSALPQLANAAACRWIRPPSDPLQGVKVHTSTLRRASNPPSPPATQPGGDGCAQQCCGPQRIWSCAVLPRRTVRQLVSTNSDSCTTCWGGGPRHHHERSVGEPMPPGHTRTLMTMSHLCRSRSHCFRRQKPFLCVYRPPFAASLSTPCCIVQSNHVCSIVLHWAEALHALSLLSEPPGGMGGPVSGHLDSTLNVLDPHSSIVIHCPEDPCD